MIVTSFAVDVAAIALKKAQCFWKRRKPATKWYIICI